MKRTIVSAVSLAVIFAGLQGFAQVRQDRPQRGDQPQAEPTRPAHEGSHQGSIESKLALWLATCNNVQIEVSQLAAQKASDPAVKQFAQQMVEEHSRLNTQLAQFVARSDRDRLRTAATGGQDRTRTPGQTDLRQQTDAAQHQTELQRRTETAVGRAGHDPFEEIAAEAARKSAQMITGLLQEKQGTQFDMCYAGLQVFAHINFVAELEAMQGHGSEQFQQVVTKATQATKSDLERAKELAGKISQSAGAERVTRRPER